MEPCSECHSRGDLTILNYLCLALLGYFTQFHACNVDVGELEAYSFTFS